MSAEETSRLLRNYGITPNKFLGQNFTVDYSLFAKLAQYANLTKDDVLLDAGAGFGSLTSFLSDRCRSVVAVEKDPIVAGVLRERLQLKKNVTVILGDVLKEKLPDYNKVVAIPPYYLSTRFITWLLGRRLDCAVLVLQKEFSNRLVAAAGSEAYSWLTVIAYYRSRVELLDLVPKEAFHPQPEIDSKIVRLVPCEPRFKVKDERFFTQMLKWLFTQRNKKLGNALVPFIRSVHKIGKAEAEIMANSSALKNMRVRGLNPEDFGELTYVLAD